MVEGARLESECTFVAYRGFESRPLRQKYKGPSRGLSFLEEGMGIRALFELSTGAAGFNDAQRPSRPLRQKDQ